jgi:hypothetical protein
MKKIIEILSIFGIMGELYLLFSLYSYTVQPVAGLQEYNTPQPQDFNLEVPSNKPGKMASLRACLISFFITK